MIDDADDPRPGAEAEGNPDLPPGSISRLHLADDAPVEAGPGPSPSEVAFVCPAPIDSTIGTDDSSVVGAVGADPPSRLLTSIEELGARLDRRLEALQAAFDREVRAEATREKVVDRLHAELQEARNDLHLNLLRPVFVDLIQLHDDVGKVVASQGEVDPAPARWLELFRGVQAGIEDILYRQGVETFEGEGEEFDPRRQRAYSTQATDDPALNKRIAGRLRKGFRLGEKIIRPEIVRVHAFKR